MTAYEFGYAVGSLEKQSFFPGVIGGTIGAVQAPQGNRLEGFGRGIVRDWGTQLGAGVGAGGGGILAHNVGRLLGPKGRLLATAAGALGGGALGGTKGYELAGKVLGPASYQRPTSPNPGNI